MASNVFVEISGGIDSDFLDEVQLIFPDAERLPLRSNGTATFMLSEDPSRTGSPSRPNYGAWRSIFIDDRTVRIRILIHTQVVDSM